MHQTTIESLDDAELLRDYVATRSEQAFGRIVERYIPLVHAAALRQCRNDPHAAGDVTQVVFMILAKKAPRISPDSVLSGWLARATCFAARGHHRAESRRKRHEARAAAARQREDPTNMRHGNDPNTDAAHSGELWNRISPLLDQLLTRLPSAARNVLAMRFLEGNTYARIGKRLGITEEAARKRAERALAAIRTALRRQGISSYDDALESALMAAAPVPVPVALTRTVVAGVGKANHHTVILKGALKLMAWTKAKAAVVGVAAALLAGGGGMLAKHLGSSSDNVPVPLTAAARASAVPSARVNSPASQLALRLARGKVRTESGQPVTGARVLVSLAARQMDFLELNSELEKGLRPPPADQQATTDADGSFELRLAAAPAGAVVLARDGAVVANASELSGTDPLTVRPYGRVEGTLRLNHKPLEAGSEVLLTTGWRTPQSVRFSLRALTDATGHFAIEHVPAGQYLLHLADENGRIAIDPGTTAMVDLDPVPGPALVGKLDGMKMPAWAMFLLQEPQAPSPSTAPAGVFVRESRQFNFYTEPDGSFRLDRVPAGAYRLVVNVLTVGQPVGLAERDVRIPLPQEGQLPTPVEMGTIKLKVRGR